MVLNLLIVLTRFTHVYNVYVCVHMYTMYMYVYNVYVCVLLSSIVQFVWVWS